MMKWLGIFLLLGSISWGVSCDCDSPKMMCSLEPVSDRRACVDPRNNVFHCGACNNRCEDGASCVSGRCTAPPPPLPGCEGGVACEDDPSPGPTPPRCGLPGAACCESGRTCDPTSNQQYACVEIAGRRTCEQCGKRDQYCCDPATHPEQRSCEQPSSPPPSFDCCPSGSELPPRCKDVSAGGSCNPGG